MPRNTKRWKFTIRSDDGAPFVVRAAQQYAGLPQHGLVLGVYQRTTDAGYSILVKPCCIADLRDLLDKLLAAHPASAVEVTFREHDQYHGGTLHIVNSPDGLRFRVSRGDAYPKTSGTALLKPASVTELRSALVEWLSDNEIAE